MRNEFVSICAIFFGISSLSAQNWDLPNSLDSSFREKAPIPWTHLREADVKYAKRITRVIDTREKNNFCLQWPKSPMSKTLIEWATVPGIVDFNDSVAIRAYRNEDFSSMYSTAELLERMTTTMIVDVRDPNDPDALVQMEVPEILNPDQIVKFKLIEDWFFDSKHSTFYPRIIAIAPVFRKTLQSGQQLPETPLCWFKYEDLRPLMATKPVFNRANNAAMLSMEQYFEMRMFSSYITKESNAFDLAINEFEEFRDDGLGALLESERIKNKLFVFEHDLWQY